MDPLDHLAGSAADLLGRVDGSLLAAGAPGDHRIWPLLRRVRALPGDAAHAVTGLRAAPLVAAGGARRTLLRRYDEAHGALADGGSWQGSGAEAFAAHRAALAAHLADGAESLAGRIEATAAYADAIADWISRTRAALARTLGDVLGSAEAVAMVTAGTGDGSIPAALAAAEIGARVLTTVAEAYDEAESLPPRWAPALLDLAFMAPDGPTTRPDTTRIVL